MRSSASRQKTRIRAFITWVGRPVIYCQLRSQRHCYQLHHRAYRHRRLGNSISSSSNNRDSTSCRQQALRTKHTLRLKFTMTKPAMT